VGAARQRFENPPLPGGIAEEMLPQSPSRHVERV
jgi:hypothetical protein